MTDAILNLLEELRQEERAQTRFYRALASAAEDKGDAALLDRFNDLHADEQHHLSKLTARLLELGAVPGSIPGSDPVPPPMGGWEEAVRTREEAEVGRYEDALSAEMDPATRAILEEILESERNHARELGGKWMSA